jgi:hypothetical protein
MASRAQTAEAEAIRIETIRYMLDVRGTFGHESEQSFPISLGLNHKGGMHDQEFSEYLKKSIMKLFPDAAPMRGQFDKLAAEREKLIVESAALASNGDPLIFDTLNELIVGAADIQNNSGDASSDKSGGGGKYMGGDEGVC